MATVQTGIATDLITFSRTSNATLTDSDGKIKWAPHNLLTNSEQFDAAAWSVFGGATRTGTNVAVAPNGTTTADAIRLTSADTASNYYQVPATLASDAFTFGIWVKRNAATNQTFQIFANIRGVTPYGRSGDLIATDTWQLFTITHTSTGGTFGSVFGVIGNVAGTQADLLVWGAHLYRSDLGGMKSNTSAYPLYNPTTPKNLIGFTEDWSNAAWTKVNIAAFGSGSVANAILAPNGLQTADKVVESTASSQHAVSSSATVVASTPYTVSVYAKAAERNIIRVLNYDGGSNGYGVIVNLSNGTATVITFGTTTGNSYSVVPSGDGWYRISVTSSIAGTTRQCYLNIYNNSSVESYAGDGVSGFYLWGAQLSDSASLDTYVPNYGAAPTAAAYYGPRLDADPVTLVQRGLLVEEARTNSLLQSAAFDQSPWTSQAFNAGSVAPTVTAITAIAPDGTQTADTISFGAVSSGTVNRLIQTSSQASGTNTFTGSVWLKLPSGTATAYLWLDDGTSGASVGQALISLTTTWTRFSITATVSPSQPGNMRFSIAQKDGSTLTAFDLHAWGAQLELGSFATSYIPTGAATATRNPDVASVSTQAFPYSSTESSIVIAYDIIGNENGTGSGTQYLGSLNAGGNERIDMIAQGSGIGPLLYTIVGGSTVVTLSGASTTVQVNTPWKAGAAIKNADYAASRNGSTPTTVTTAGAMPSAATELGIGAATFGAQLNGHIRQITYLPRRISNTELQARTV